MRSVVPTRNGDQPNRVAQGEATVNAVARKSVTRRIATTLTAVLALPKAALFRLLNGAAIQRMLDQGDLITVNTVLDRLGVGDDFKDGYRSWAGRHIAQAYRVANQRQPLKAWVQHRTSGRWIFVYCYTPADESITAGLRTYPRTSHLVPVSASYSEAA